MTRLNDLTKLLESDYAKGSVIEPESRQSLLRDDIKGVVDTYNPQVILKAGIGQGSLLLEIAEYAKSYVVVVEPSMDIIKGFLEANKENPILENIHIINGEYSQLPVDYYKINCLLCVDYFEFMETGRAVDEFKRVLEFESILFLATPVLADKDIEGVYDDFMRGVFSLHTDYYLQEDLNTFMKLKNFKLISEKQSDFSRNIESLVSLSSKAGLSAESNALEMIEEQKESFISLYSYDGNNLNVPYYTGVFMREKIK